MSLDGKYALITGSSRGIGRGIALKLAANHVNVAVHYYQNEVAAKETLDEIRKLGSNGFIVQVSCVLGRSRHCSLESNRNLANSISS